MVSISRKCAFVGIYISVVVLVFRMIPTKIVHYDSRWFVNLQEYKVWVTKFHRLLMVLDTHKATLVEEVSICLRKAPN